MDSMDDEKRQLGDMSVYSYYYRALGPTISFFFVLFAVCNGFFSTFPGKHSYMRTAGIQ